MPVIGPHLARLRQRRATRIAVTLLAMLAFVLATGLLDGGVGVAPSRLFVQPWFPLANALPGLLLAGVLLVLTRRLLLSLGLALLAEGLVYGVNALKAANLGTPLMPADFQMVGQLQNGGAHLLAGYLPHSPWPYLALLAGIALVIALWRYEPPLVARRPRAARAVAGAALASLLFSVLIGAGIWNRLYNGRVLWLEPWSANVTANHSGLISSLLLYDLHFGHGGHKPDPAAAERLIAQTRDALRARLAEGDGGAQPDIVVVQSESFFDPRIMRGYQHSHLTPNLERLQRQGTGGPLYVPTFGGGTIRTEFEVLTGLSLRYFDELQFPYLQLNAKVVPSLVRTLRTHGYVTTAVHGNDPAFWNRTSAMKALGFDRFVSRAAFPADAPNDGKYMADSAMTDEIMAQLKDAGPPQFVFAISIEGHGPYYIPPADPAARDAIPVPAGITGQDKIELQTYLYHIAHADAELGRLAKLLAKRERPTLLMFYGDHLPALANTFHKDGFVDGGDMLAEPGTWLLIDPRNPGHASAGHASVESAASWALPGRLLARAGIHDAPYFALTQLVAPRLDQLTRAPGAPQVQEAPAQEVLDHEMANVSILRLKGKLDPLLPTANLARNDAPASPPAATPMASGIRP